jgi:hypothetical protein
MPTTVNILNERPISTIQYVSEAPNVDGEVFADPFWESVETITKMFQTKPFAGQLSSEATEIRMAHNDTHFYLSVICHDKSPEKLVVSDARRDASLDNTDSFLFILDTYQDGQNGFVFGTNSIGTQYDAQVDNEGKGNSNSNRQQGGTIGGFNINWDASWKVQTQVGDFGWSAEFEIPFRSLRYTTGENQSWGLNFQRNIQKSNEICFWAAMPVGFGLNNLSLAGSLNGLKLSKPGNLQIIPYALSRISKDFESEDAKTDTDFEIGGDIKYSISPSMTLDASYNTDFAQVEVDEIQINLDRFNLFFPEKRPFFLENAGLFTVGAPGEVDLFFSRRIGIGPDGDLVPIIGGARLSGKLNHTNIGVLNMVTDNIDALSISTNNFSVARVNHEFAQRSSLGGIFVNRQGINSPEESDYNRSFAMDGKLGLGKKAQLSGFFGKTSSPFIEEDDHAFKFKAEYNWNLWILNAAYTEVGDGFNPEVGFLARKAFRKGDFLIWKYVRMGGKFGLLEIRPHISYRGYWDFEGFRETSFLHIDNHWVWESGVEFHTGINITSEGVKEAFEISEDIFVPIGTYDHKEAQIVFQTNSSKAISISTRHVWGGFFGGNRKSNSATLRLRAGDRFSSEFAFIFNNINLPQGDFNSNIYRGRLSYSFSPEIYLQSLIQYNTLSDDWSLNVRLSWLRKANTGLYLVYNEVRDDIGIEQRSFTIKYSYLFDVLK